MSALPTGGAPHAIFHSWQNKQVIAGLCHALCFVNSNFNTPFPAFRFGTNNASGGACDELVMLMSTRMLDVGVPISDKNDDESSVGICVLGE